MTPERQNAGAGEDAAVAAVGYPLSGQLRHYLLVYGAAVAALAAPIGALNAVVLAAHVQLIEFAQWFGSGGGVDLRALTELKLLVGAGNIAATAEQQGLLARLAGFEAARAQSLSIVSAVGIVLTILVQPIIGMLSDRTRSPWGRRAPWIAAGAVTGAAGLIGMRFSTSIAMLVVTWSVAQLALNVAQGPLSATVADRVPKHRLSVASAISGAGTFLGGVLGSVAAGVLFAAMKLDSYYVLAAPVVMCCLLFVLLAKDSSSMALERPLVRWSSFLLSFVTPLRHRNYRWVWITKVVMMFGIAIPTGFSFYMLQSYVKPALSMQEAARTAPLLLLAILPGALIGMAACGTWSALIARRKPFVLAAAALSALSFTVPLALPTVVGLVMLYMLTGLALGTYLVVDQALLIEVLPDRRSSGRDLGTGAIAGNLGQALGPIVAGQLVALSGDYRTILIAGIAAVLAAGLAITRVEVA